MVQNTGGTKPNFPPGTKHLLTLSGFWGFSPPHFLGIFWEFHKLQDFWKKSNNKSSYRCDSREESLVLLVYLLHDTPKSNKKYKNSLLTHLLTAAKACIPEVQKSADTPTKSQWLARIQDIQLMEDLTMTMKEQGKKYWKIWTPYIFYKDQSPLASQFQLFRILNIASFLGSPVGLPVGRGERL